MYRSNNWKLRTRVIIRPLEPLQFSLEKGTGFVFCTHDSGPALVSWAEADGFHFCVVSTRASSRDALADTHACWSSLALFRDMFFSVFPKPVLGRVQCKPRVSHAGIRGWGGHSSGQTWDTKPTVMHPGRAAMRKALHLCSLETVHYLPGHAPKIFSPNKTVAIVTHPHFPS